MSTTNTRDAAISALVAEINEAAQTVNTAVVYSSEHSYATYRLTAAARALAILTSPRGE